MEYQDQPNTGKLFTSTKRNEKAPDMNGKITIEKDLLLAMIEEAQGEPTITIKLDGWRKKDKNNNPMVSLKVNTWKPTAAAPVQQGKDPWDD
jgi:hypothetical protein